MNVVTIKITEPIRCTLSTMSEGCRNQLVNYLNENEGKYRIGKTVEETKQSIQKLPQFVSGCFTYIQARALAEAIQDAPLI